uniref:Ras-related protein Rab-21 n=1 Tax=Globodera rostochiensis TaxID=31243 RepID=A0A914I8I9_GLORO
MEEPIKSFKVVLLGEGAVGKTSLMIRYTEDKFNDEHVSTVQAAFASKILELSGASRAELAIWDTAGQERFHALGPIYYRDSQGALLVYDISDQKSFDRVKNWSATKPTWHGIGRYRSKKPNSTHSQLVPISANVRPKPMKGSASCSRIWPKRCWIKRRMKRRHSVNLAQRPSKGITGRDEVYGLQTKRRLRRDAGNVADDPN